jgi:iron complex outermembrane recepter protein
VSNNFKNLRRSALLGSAATLIASMALGATGVSAQDADTDDDMSFEEVVVTGSRIVRRDLSAPSPISTIDASEFKFTGAQNVEQVLATLPQTIPGFGGSSNNPGNGTATVNLRGLGATRTLVLVNGRRYLQSNQSGVVDLNTIPSTLIERVEVVTGGASAVYGSDALGGVVNFIMKSDFEGLELDAQFDTTTKGDANKYNISATVGGNFADGRGNVTVYANYAKRDALFQGDRNFSTFALGEGGNESVLPDASFGLGTGLGAFGSSGIPGTRVFGGPVLPNGDRLGRFNQDGSGAVFTNADRFNYAPDNFLQLPQERFMFSAMTHYQISDAVRFYLDTTFVSNRVPQELAPTPAFLGSLEVNPDSPFFGADVQTALNGVRSDTNGDGVVDGSDNAFLPFIGRRMVENGSRQSLDTRNGYRFLVGFDGELGDGWSYDVSYSFARVDATNLLNNDVSATRFRQAVLVSDDGLTCQDASNGCEPLNIFGAGNISDAAIGFINIGASNVTFIQTQDIQGLVTGSLGDWTGAGEVGVAMGVEYRKDSSAFRPDEFLASGDVLGFNAGEATVGGFDVYEGFIEVALPLLTDSPLAKSLEATIAARVSDYSSAGTVYSYAGGLTWAPVEDISFRGQYQRAVRAPNVNELFGGNANGFPGATDPCSDANPSPSATLISLCEASGVPVGLTGNFTQANTQIEGTFGGNPNLFEEVSDTYTVGAVITPSALPGFTMSVDYYDITIDQAISTLGGGVNSILDICYNQVQDLNSIYCQAVTRRPDGNVDNVFAGNANIGQTKVSGIDLQWNYTADVDFGFFEGGSTLNFAFVGTRVLNSSSIPDLQVGGELFCEGTFGNICGRPDPKYRFNLRSTMANGPLTLSLNWRWLDSVEDDQIINDPNITAADLIVPTIAAENYFDLSFTYDIDETVQVYGGARNLFNNKPTFVGDSQQQANTFPETYDAIGTRVFIGTRLRF